MGTVQQLPPLHGWSQTQLKLEQMNKIIYWLACRDSVRLAQEAPSMCLCDVHVADKMHVGFGHLELKMLKFCCTMQLRMQSLRT